jgi:hypothetical protein
MKNSTSGLVSSMVFFFQAGSPIPHPAATPNTVFHGRLVILLSCMSAFFFNRSNNKSELTGHPAIPDKYTYGGSQSQHTTVSNTRCTRRRGFMETACRSAVPNALGFKDSLADFTHRTAATHRLSGYGRLLDQIVGIADGDGYAHPAHDGQIRQVVPTKAVAAAAHRFLSGFLQGPQPCREFRL